MKTEPVWDLVDSRTRAEWAKKSWFIKKKKKERNAQRMMGVSQKEIETSLKCSHWTNQDSMTIKINDMNGLEAAEYNRKPWVHLDINK